MILNFSYSLNNFKCQKIIEAVENRSPGFKRRTDLFLDFINKNFPLLTLDSFEHVVTICHAIQNCDLDEKQQKLACQLIKKIESLKEATLVQPAKIEQHLIGVKRKKDFSEQMPLVKIPCCSSLSMEEMNLLSALLQPEQSNFRTTNPLLYKNLDYALRFHDLNWRKIKGKDGYTILHYLSSFKDFALVKAIVAKIEQINLQDNFAQQTPLHLAYKSDAVVLLLINKGADFTLEDAGGKTILDYLVTTKNYHLIEVIFSQFISTESSQKFYLSIVKKAFREADSFLIKLIFKIAKTDAISCSTGEVIFYATQLHPDNLKLIIANKISVDHTSKNKSPALYYACLTKNLQLVRLFLQAGANANQTCPNKGLIVFNAALKSADIKIIEEIVKSIDCNFILNNGDNLYELVKGTNTISCYQATSILAQAKNLDPLIAQTLLSTRLLASIWGVQKPDFFFFKGKKIDYMGLYPYFTLKKTNQFVVNYLPTLAHHFPLYLTAEKADQLITFCHQLFSNYNLAETNAKTILENSYSLPQALLFDSLEHVAAIVFDQKRVIKCNRGEGCDDFSGLRIYELGKKIDEKTIFAIRTNRDLSFFNSELDQNLELKEISFLPLQEQKVGNCTWASLKAALYAFLILISTEEETHAIKEVYKSYSSFARLIELKDYLEKVSQGKLEPDWLLLAAIWQIIEKKLTKKLIGLQKENFAKALALFDEYLTPEICHVTPKNKYELFYYFLIRKNQIAITNFLKEQSDFNPNRSIRGIKIRSLLIKVNR